MKVQRYSMELWGDTGGDMFPADDGAYVRHSDIAPRLAAADAMEAALEEIQRFGRSNPGYGRSCAAIADRALALARGEGGGE